MLILVVDDNCDCADTQAMVLRAWGHEVMIAYDGPTAIALAHERPPDVMFIDIKMPGMSGYELARFIKADKGCSHTKLYAITGLTNHDLQINSLEGLFEGFLLKPVDAQNVRFIVDSWHADR